MVNLLKFFVIVVLIFLATLPLFMFDSDYRDSIVHMILEFCVIGYAMAVTIVLGILGGV